MAADDAFTGRRTSRPTVDQTLAFFMALYKGLGVPTSPAYIGYSAGALLAWMEDPSHTPPIDPDDLDALRFGGADPDEDVSTK